MQLGFYHSKNGKTLQAIIGVQGIQSSMKGILKTLPNLFSWQNKIMTLL
jgi:hypothetical protein